jgi:hypothetical protein
MWGEVSLVAVATGGLFASDEALRDEEYLIGLAEATQYDALPLRDKVATAVSDAWNDLGGRDIDTYASAQMTVHFDDAIRLAGQMTNDWCGGKLTPSQVNWLRRLNQGLENLRAGFRREREAAWRAAALEAERAALVRLGTVIATMETAG